MHAKFSSMEVCVALWQTHPQKSRVVLCDDPAGLKAIHERGVDMVVWQEMVPNGLIDDIEASTPERLLHGTMDFTGPVIHLSRESWEYHGIAAPWHQRLKDLLLAGALCLAPVQSKHEMRMELRCEPSRRGPHAASLDLLHPDGNQLRAIIPLRRPYTQGVPFDTPVTRIPMPREYANYDPERYRASEEHILDVPARALVLFKGKLYPGGKPWLHRTPSHAVGHRMLAVYSVC